LLPLEQGSPPLVNAARSDAAHFTVMTTLRVRNNGVGPAQRSVRAHSCTTGS
jgi:hypothetical protein